MTERPTVLLVDPHTERRRELGRGLSGKGYEVVPAVDVAEGLRFAEGLGPAVIVVPADLPELEQGDLLARFARGDAVQTLVLLGRPRIEEAELPQEVLLLDTDGLTTPGLLRKLRLVLLGREIGVEPDIRMESLIGDLSLTPPLELVRTLGRARFTGRVVLEGGEISLDQGRVVGAQAGAARRVKAFCRLARRVDGVFRVWPEPMVAGGSIDASLDELIIQAVEDVSLGELPHRRTRVVVQMGPTFFSANFSDRQQEILTLAHDHEATVGELLDHFPETDGKVLEDVLILREEGVLSFQEAPARVHIVTDSTSDLPTDVRRRLGVEVVPLSVLFGDTRYVDGVTIRPRRFYELLESDEAPHPSTEPPSVADFGRAYRQIGAEQDVVSIHISSELSETFAHAREAAERESSRSTARRPASEPMTLEVIDSRVTSLSLGILVIFAARMALRGMSAQELASRLPGLAERLHTLFVVDTLEYLAKGGRIGKARAFIGGVLGIKPILSFEDGQVAAIDRVRGGRAAHPRILEHLSERFTGERPLICGIAHAKAPVWADRLRRLVEDRFPVAEMILTEIGPVVGTHGGPGTVGVVAFEPTDEERELLAPVEEPQ